MTTSDSRILLGLLQGLARTPLWLLRTLGILWGLLAILAHGRRWRRCRINLKACYPQRSRFWRWRIACMSLIHEACNYLEIPYLWQCSPGDIDARVVRRYGLELIEACQARGEGVVFITPHFGSWEMAALFMSGRIPLFGMYRPLRSPLLDRFAKQGREHTGTTLVPTDRSGVRRLVQALDEGYAVGMLPDHAPRRKEDGVMAEFFGVPANTSILLARLAQRNNVVVFLAQARRCWGGYEVSVSKADPRVYSQDREQAACGINATVEAGIAEDVAQYWWSYPRFRKRLIEPESLYS